jgi:hypothetical protein
MTISRDGAFSVTIGSDELSRGLRPSRRTPRNSKFLVECQGAIGYDNVLQALENIDQYRLDQSSIFPFPQLFLLDTVILVCTQTQIYELVGGILTLRLTVDSGTTWSFISSYDYVYGSNGKVSVVRDAISKAWSASTLPIAGAMVNYKGQVMIASPGVIQHYNYTIFVGPITLTLTTKGHHA